MAQIPEEIKQKIEVLVKEFGKQSTAPDKETPDWLESDIRRGLIAGYSLAQDEIQKLKEAAKELIHLHNCEMEGVSSGKPTPEQWFNAVNKLSEIIYPNS